MPELPEHPLNREPDLQCLIQSFITYEHGYDRNHCLFPILEKRSHIVRIDGDVRNSMNLSISNLEKDYQQHSVICALQCAGNRRHTMRTVIKEVSGLDWFDGAVMNCKWTGPRLNDILKDAQVYMTSEECERANVAFGCYATPCQEDTWYGSSIPLRRALDSDKDVILALKMNDQPLTVEHGFPVRVIAPGIAGARAVKWLDRITVQMEECNNHYMQRDYKFLPPEVTDMNLAQKFWHVVPPVQEMPVNSAIGLPQNGTTIQRTSKGTVLVQGYALPSGDGGPVTRVEVSADGGVTWMDADLIQHKGENKWTWKFWKANVKVEPGPGRIINSRATDAGGNTQPKQSQWNLRGVCYNGYGEASDLTIQ